MEEKGIKRNDRPSIALVMMIKDEEKRLHVSLDSVRGYVDQFIIYDTGSTDKTLQILRNYCDKYNIPLGLIEGKFVDFATSRNVLLEYADTFENIEYLILLDSNDELTDGTALHEFLVKIAEPLKEQFDGFLICQEWHNESSSINKMKTINKYYTTRLVHARCEWRYKSTVHEYLTHLDPNKPLNVYRCPDSIKLIQNRDQDDDKSVKRFDRDKLMLQKQYDEDSSDPRTSFYLAQTFECLHEYEEAFRYYKIRANHKTAFYEEVYHSLFRLGNISQKLGHPWHESFTWYMKSYEYLSRVEPLLNIAEMYRLYEKYDMSYSFVKIACDLVYPDNLVLFVDRHCYDYIRWHLMAKIAIFVGEIEVGKAACLRAIKSQNLKIDRDQLLKYISLKENVKINLELQEFNKLLKEKLKKAKKKKKIQKDILDEILENMGIPKI